MTQRTILLLQARTDGDPMLAHELGCFAARAELPVERFRPLNMTCQPLDPSCLDGHAAVMIGGSGDFSVVKGGFDWHAPMLALLREVVARRVPTFASCFGHQAIIQAFGGTLARDASHAEVGTFDMTLTDAGTRDPLFGTLPRHFRANLGHLDRVTLLPPEFELLAFSALCEVQATRMRHAPVVTTQFHPELTWRDNLERWLNYLRHYRDPAESFEEAEARARAACFPCPESEGLLRSFVALEGLA